MQTGFIMNTANPSQCPGNATGWHLFYYRSTTDNPALEYLAVYRPAPNGTQYSLVSGSNFSYSIPQPPSGYLCIQYSITQFVVQQGDVIAACVQPSGSGRVGIVATASGSLTAQLYTGTPAITCGSPLPSTILQSSFAAQSITLHVSLGVSSWCVLYCYLVSFCFRYQWVCSEQWRVKDHPMTLKIHLNSG